MYHVSHDSNASLLPLALVGIGLALWLLASVGSRNSNATKKRRKVIAIAVGAMLLLGLLYTLLGNPRHWPLFALFEDGSWGAVTIDGRQVSSSDYTIYVRDREVVAGRDGCNDWGYTDRRGPDGSRMMITTLAECREDDPVQMAYWSLRSPTGLRLKLASKNELHLAAGSHAAVFRRCTWVVEPLPPETIGSEPKRCVTS